MRDPTRRRGRQSQILRILKTLAFAIGDAKYCELILQILVGNLQIYVCIISLRQSKRLKWPTGRLLGKISKLII